MLGKCREMSDYQFDIGNQMSIPTYFRQQEPLQEFEDRDDKVIRPCDLL